MHVKWCPRLDDPAGDFPGVEAGAGHQTLAENPLKLETGEGQQPLGPDYTDAQLSDNDPIFHILNGKKPI